MLSVGKKRCQYAVSFWSTGTESLRNRVYIHFVREGRGCSEENGSGSNDVRCHLWYSRGLNGFNGSVFSASLACIKAERDSSLLMAVYSFRYEYTVIFLEVKAWSLSKQLALTKRLVPGLTILRAYKNTIKGPPI